jgi:hypothetical protein
MNKTYVRTKNSKNRIIMQLDIGVGFAGEDMMSTELLQRNAQKRQAGRVRDC